MENPEVSPPNLTLEQSRMMSLAALIGDSFSIDWLTALSEEKPSQILMTLDKAIKHGWIFGKTPGFYSFTTSNERQKWLNLLPKKEEESFQNRIVDLLLQEEREDDDKALLMAPHLLRIKNEEEKSLWLLRAGNAYRKAFRTEDALQCYAKILQDLSSLDGQKTDSIFTTAAINYSKISAGRHDTTKVLSLLNEGLVRAKRWDLKKDEALLKMHLAKNEWLLSNYVGAMKYFKEGWVLIKGLEDSRLTRSAMTFSTFFLFWQGRFREAVQNYEKSVPDVEKYPRGGFPLLGTMTIGRCYSHIGQITQGLGMLDSLRTYCLEKGDLYLTANASLTIGTTMLDIGRIDDAIQYLDYSIEESTKAHNDWVSILAKLALAYAFSLIGQWERSILNLNDFLRDSKKVKVTMGSYPYLMALCWCMEEGISRRYPDLSLEREIDRMIRGDNVYVKGIAYRFLGILHKQKGLPTETVIQYLNLSLKYLEESGDEIELAKSRFEFSRIYLLLGREDEAQKFMDAACDVIYPLNPNLIPDDLRPLLKYSSREQNLLKEILAVGKEVVTIRENHDLVQHIISTVNRISGAERGAIFLIGGKSRGPSLVLRASKNLTSEQITNPSFKESMRLIEEVATTGKGRIKGMQTGKDSDFSGPIRSLICVPMILKDKVVGVLYHDNRLLSSAFKESDLELLSYFAAQAAFALDNALAYDEIKKLNYRLKEEKLYFEQEHFQNLHFDDIVGESAAIKNILEKVDQVAKTDTTVLILGETGVGKEMVARAVHRHSLRCDQPFIRVFCSALPDSLIPSELFGHEKGAFTGATRRRIGRFELANHGTLFLDEIGDLPLEIQIRLLRVLQSKEFERVGGNETIRSDFRLLAATNRDLEQAVAVRKFRTDFYYRLNVFPIYVPPLRERKDDIPLLAKFFLKIYGTKLGKLFDGIPKSEMDKLLEYDWPGNVRELENIIERGTILSQGPFFRVPELGIRSDFLGKKEDLSLEEMERRHILWALQKTGWKERGQGGAAEILKIHPSTLRFRMKKLKIQRPTDFSRKLRPISREVN
jgi:formate hydrogenlyase transcriptional activator